METYSKDFENINYVKTFKELKLRYDQSKDRLTELNRSRSSSENNTPSLFRATSNDRFKPERIDFDKDEDSWIEEDDDEIDSKIEASAHNLAHNSFNDDTENNIDYFVDFKKTSSKCSRFSFALYKFNNFVFNN